MFIFTDTWDDKMNNGQLAPQFAAQGGSWETSDTTSTSPRCQIGNHIILEPGGLPDSSPTFHLKSGQRQHAQFKLKWTTNNLHLSLWHEAARERCQIQSLSVPGAGLEITLPWGPAVCLIHLQLFTQNPGDNDMPSSSWDRHFLRLHKTESFIYGLRQCLGRPGGITLQVWN